MFSYISTALEVSPERIAYVENATAGVNTILRAVSRKLNKNDAILATSLGYDAVARTLEEISKLSGCKLVIVQIPLPSTRNEIVKRVQSALDHNPNVKLAIFDHITSASALILPLKDLIGVCKRRVILTLIDGAHAIGHVPIDIGGLQPDFYVTNLHKWLFNPRGCAVLYIRNQELIDTYRIKPLVLSHGYNQGFLSEFYWTGTADYSRFLVVPSAIKFYEKLGGQELMERNHDLCLRAAHFLARCFGTSLLVTDPTTIGCIAIIPTPPSLLQNKIITQTQTHPRATLPTSKESKKLDQLAELPRLWYFATCLHDQLLYEYKIECMCVVVQGKLCVRISAQVYNDEDDYVRLADVILKLSGINDRGSMESLTEMFKDGRILHLKNVLTKL
ncbi:pyridoxal phosphate-dependent transferase [Paraphysoderma sedebokerense]|nr:pyridoxal phosphate-dependent transferase [Paraphysoderma sedebokerense]